MSHPPGGGPPPHLSPELLGRLTTLSQELAGTFRPATAVDLVARALTELLAPDRLSIVLLDAVSNRLSAVYDSGPEPASTDDPLVQLALRRGPLLFARDVAAAARAQGVELGPSAPGAWIGAPLVTGSRPVGAVSLTAERPDAFHPEDLMIVQAVVAQVAIALENARLVELLSSAKREWEQTVDAVTVAMCVLNPTGAVRRANPG